MNATVHGSARKHGVTDEDILHAIDHALVIEDAGDDPDRWLVIGPDRAANLLEVVVVTTRRLSGSSWNFDGDPE
jgi:uncharacterized DUF497 family protein